MKKKLVEMDDLSTGFIISEEESANFSRFSGDYNPVHIDRLAARRLQFGDTVIHGVHHMLRAWDASLSRFPEMSAKRITTLDAIFVNSVHAGQPISCAMKVSADASLIEIIATADEQRILVLSLGLANDSTAARRVNTLDSPLPVEPPVDQEFPPREESGKCALYCDKALARELFPRLRESYADSLLAQLVACTRIVGMKCPGLHSLFSRISLTFNNPDSELTDLCYDGVVSDSRFKVVKIGVQGPEITGTLTACFRPPPVEQPLFDTILAEVVEGVFSNQRALVIGGSRGLGETTAKILAAGGADVTITYNSGEADALNVEREIHLGKGRCKTRRIDVLAASPDDFVALAGEQPWSHVYYFASPRITPHRGQGWNRELYDKYGRYFLEAYSRLVTAIAQSARKNGSEVAFFVPSSAFIDFPEKGFAEYAVAKASTEALCDQLQSRHGNINFHMPRLPRMATDQTSSIIPIKTESALAVMKHELNRWAISDGAQIKRTAVLSEKTEQVPEVPANRLCQIKSA